MEKVELKGRYDHRIAPISEVLRALGNFAPEVAAELDREFLNEMDSLLGSMASRLASAAADLLEERELSQEDEDSSGVVHLLMRLKQRAEALTKG